MVEPLNAWIGGLFGRDNIDRLVDKLVVSQESGQVDAAREVAKKRLADAEARLRRHQSAIEAGVDPAALVEVINTAQAERAAARAELDNAPAQRTLDRADVFAMVDSLGDVGARLGDAKPQSLIKLYSELRLDLRYEPEEQAVYVAASPRVVNVRVRGRSCTLFTRRVFGE
ncbi:hypothetical protein BU204_37230 [Actinophytocola xanthii]|uniref:Uncharacterized protein n=1 Tax=Actinophytocola xanthii TaxID=1912961 RepID=A0A1Q8BT68_9PSEU|nr:hypothetical protein BU204_37230 [Actinophytocola xanthii]